MPFRNMLYTGERLFPIATSDAEFSFRAWVNYSTSVDRVFTVSYSKDAGYDGKLLEIRTNKVLKNKQDNTTFKQVDIIPKSGFEKFIAKVDSLNLLEMKDQEVFNIGLHEPYSLYVIEIKSHGKVNQFRFNTYFPTKGAVGQHYQQIEKLIFREFDFKFYTKK